MSTLMSFFKKASFFVKIILLITAFFSKKKFQTFVLFLTVAYANLQIPSNSHFILQTTHLRKDDDSKNLHNVEVSI